MNFAQSFKTLTFCQGHRVAGCFNQDFVRFGTINPVATQKLLFQQFHLCEAAFRLFRIPLNIKNVVGNLKCQSHRI